MTDEPDAAPRPAPHPAPQPGDAPPDANRPRRPHDGPAHHGGPARIDLPAGDSGAATAAWREAPPGGAGGIQLWRFAALALTAVAIASAAFLLWQLRETMMMAFGAVIVAVLLLALADLLRIFLPIGQRWAVTAAAVLLVVLIAAFAWLIGAQVRAQATELWQALPAGIERIERQLGVPLFGQGGALGGTAGSPEATETSGQGAGAAGQDDEPQPQGADAAPEGTAAAPAGGDPQAGQAQSPAGAAAPQEGPEAGAETSATGAVLSRLSQWLGSYGYPVVNAVFGTILVAIAGVFLALAPGTYRRGTVMLFPPAQHARIDETMTYMGRALRRWLVGQLIAMAIIGTLVALGTWALGLPAPLALGLFAAMTEFVPVVGPIAGAVPAVLLSLTEGGSTVLWTVLLFVAVQQVESNMIAPLVQERMVSVPPALFLLAVVGFGGIFGILGVIFAAPLAVVTYVAVQKLWVRDALHERTHVTGESDPAD